MQGLWAQSRGMESDPKYEQRELPALATRGGRPLSLLSPTLRRLSLHPAKSSPSTFRGPASSGPKTVVSFSVMPASSPTPASTLSTQTPSAEPSRHERRLSKDRATSNPKGQR